MVIFMMLLSLASATKEAIDFLLPRTVWCRVEAQGVILHIRAVPDGPEVPHGATMTVEDGRQGGAPVAYYYPMPTPLLSIAGRLGFDPGTADLLATGVEVTTRSGRWCQFRRCSEDEFDAARASSRARSGG